MLWFEREVVDALCSLSEPSERDAVGEWVDGSLRAMPEVLRAGVAALSVALGVWARLTGRSGDALVASMAASPLPPVRQHLRLLRSLVLFGDLELGGRVAS